MKTAVLIMVAFGSVLLAAGKARAQCSCTAEYVNITPRAEFKLAQAVFVGKVISVKKGPPDKDDHYIETVTFEVTKAWKQDLPASLTISNLIYGCINGWEENEEWLVYLYKPKDGKLTIYCCCTRTRPFDKAEEDVKAFAGEPSAKILTSNPED